eukprot:COSAG02_NODE_37536_length_440_cov_1.777126_1_plen_39_part_10
MGSRDAGCRGHCCRYECHGREEGILHVRATAVPPVGAVR